MINFIIMPNIFLALIVAVTAILLYELRYVRQEVARDTDLLFVAISFLYSSILIIYGWRLDPILLFSQGLVVVSLVVATWEIIRLRGLIIDITKSQEENQENKEKD